MKNSGVQKTVIDIYLRIIILTLLLVLSFLIVKPFLLIIAWSLLLAVALFPLYKKFEKLFGKKKKWAVILFVTILLAIVLVPTFNLSRAAVETSSEILSSLNSKEITIPSPNESVKDWPLVGSKVYKLWNNASVNLEKFIIEYNEPLKNLIQSFFKSLGGLMTTAVLAIFSLIIAGVFLGISNTGFQNSVKLGNRILPGKGEELVKMIVDTIRSVVKGILLVAIIQSLLAYIGFAVAGLQGAAFFAILVMIFAIIQLPPIIAMIPAIAIFASQSDSSTSVLIFTVYSVLVSLSDNFLKPILLGKGLETPMLVILIGAIGGMLFMGILGLFIGPVVLAIAYNLYLVWVNEDVQYKIDPNPDSGKLK